MAAGPDFTGTWTGQANQVGRDRPFAVSMTITAKGGEIHYPDNNCNGTLTKGGTSGDFSFYVEKITSGAYDASTNANGCLAGGIALQKAGNAVVFGWTGSYQGKPIIVYATLTRSAAPTTVPTVAKTTAKTTVKATDKKPATPAPKPSQ
jgi:hypothetical protein